MNFKICSIEIMESYSVEILEELILLLDEMNEEIKFKYIVEKVLGNEERG